LVGIAKRTTLWRQCVVGGGDDDDPVGRDAIEERAEDHVEVGAVSVA